MTKQLGALQSALVLAKKQLGGLSENAELSPKQEAALADLEAALQKLQDAEYVHLEDKQALADFVAPISEDERLFFVLVDYWNAIIDAFEIEGDELPAHYARKMLRLEAKTEFFEELQEQVLRPAADAPED